MGDSHQGFTASESSPHSPRKYLDRIMAEVDEAQQKAQLNSTLKEYIAEWRKTREAEEEELKQLKEKQAKRKEIRAEQERKPKEEEEKKKAQEEEDAKRKEMLDAKKASNAQQKKSVTSGNKVAMTKDQLQEEMKASLALRIKPLELDAMDSDEMRAKAEELFNLMVQLETEKYDYEQRQVSQEQELNELKERQKAILRQKALKKGMDPEAFTEKY